MGTSPFHNDPRNSLMLPKGGPLELVPFQQEYYVPRQEYAPSPGPDNSAFLQYWHTILRKKGTILLFTLVGFALAALLTMQQTPIFQARSTLELQGINENFMNMKSNDPNVNLPDYSSEGILQTQIRILQSNTLLKRVVQKVSSGEGKPPVETANRFLAWRKVLGLPDRKSENVREDALAYGVTHLGIKNLESTRIIEITSDSPDRNLARDIVNTLANEYIDQNLESRWKQTQHTGDWLTKQLEGLKVKLERSEDELQTYAQAAGLMFTGEKDNVSEDKLRQLQKELLNAQSDRAIKQSKYEMSLTAAPEALPEVLDDGALKDYQARLADLRRQYAELSSSLTPAHYRVQKVQAQISELLKGLEHERANVIKRIKTEYDGAKRREDLIRGDYGGQTRLVTSQSGKLIHYSILKREVDTSRQLYDSMLQRVKEAGITAAMRASNVRIVDVAEAPLLPYKPSPVRNSIMGVLAGLMLGLGFVFVRERSDRSIQAPGDSQGYLSVPEFGVIPSSQADAGKSLYGTPRGGLPEAGNGANGGRDGRESLELAMMQRGPSLIAESFRSTLTSILFSNQNANRENQRIYVLTSPSPSEGKTTVLTNLGLAMVETQRRVLLIDADMRRPRLHDIFDIPNDYGLGDVLASADVKKAALRAIVPTEAPGMCVMPSGPPAASISTLLHSAQLPRLLEFLSQEFDAVLIDTPPMLHLPDARILARLAGGVIMVIRSGKTTRDTALLARQRFQEDGTPVLGTILNDWNPRQKAGYGYRNYEAGYRQYAESGYAGSNGKSRAENS